MKINRSSIGCLFSIGIIVFSSYALSGDVPPQYDCPAGRLAIARQQAIIEREMAKIDGLTQDSQRKSEGINKCLGSLAIDLKIPTFPTMGDIIDKIKKESCTSVKNTTQSEIDKIKNKYSIPSSIDPWADAMKYTPQTDFNKYIPNLTKENHNIIDTKEPLPVQSDAFPWSID